ncbi:MAG: hypothetical protein ACI9WU_001292 [Myxococcota bacterium]|jgi:hypothetical protein
MPERFGILAAVLGLIIGTTAMVGGFSGPAGWQAMLFCGLVVAGAVAFELVLRKKRPNNRALPGLTSDDLSSATQELRMADDDSFGRERSADLSAHDLSSPGLATLAVRSISVEPPPIGPYMGVALGLIEGGMLAPLVPMGRQLPARAATTLATSRADQQRVEVLLHITTATQARPTELCRLTIYGIPPGPPRQGAVRLVVGIDRWGKLKAQAALGDGSSKLPHDMEGDATLPVAQA